MHLVEKFLIFEENKSLFAEKIMGVTFWHYIRFNVFYKIVRQRENFQKAHKSLADEHPLTVIFLFLKQLKFFLKKSSVWSLTKKDILVINHPRRVKNGDYFDCIYTDPFLSQTQHSYYVFELPYEGRHFEPTRTENLRYLDKIFLLTAIYHRIMRKVLGSTLSSDEVKRLSSILNNLNSEFDVHIPIDEFLRSVEIAILKHKSYLSYFNRVLNKVKPKIILEVVSYIDVNFAINQLAKEKGIPTIEIQHGTMGKYHIAYNFPKDIESNSFPDYVFMFGQYWKDSTRLPISPSNVRVVGSPYYEEKVESYKSSANLDERKVILFISQPTIGDALSKLAAELDHLLDQKRYRTIYKLHPSEFSIWKERYPWLIVKKIDVADNALHDIHYYLSTAFVQVGVASTVLFEGIGYGLNTAIFKAPFHEHVEELYQNGPACLIEDANQLASYINSCENQKIFNTDYFWKRDSMKNFNKNINNIISKG